MDAHRIALVIPCFNGAATLHRAVDSGLRQSFLRELLIVDDCSTDASSAVMTQMSALDSRVHILTTDFNIGPGGARNLGVREARADFVCFLDADDELIGDFFADAMAVIARDSTVKCVKGEMEFVDPVKGYILPTSDPRYRSAVLSSSCGAVLDRTAFTRLGGFPESPAFRGLSGGEDVALMQAVMTYCQPIARIARPCYRVWSTEGAHIDNFLAHTRLTEGGFEFVDPAPDQAPGGALACALDRYLADVAINMQS